MTSDFDKRGGSDPLRPAEDRGTTAGTGSSAVPGGSTMGAMGRQGFGATSETGMAGSGMGHSSDNAPDAMAEPAGASASFGDDRSRLREAASREANAAKDAASSARDAVRDGVSTLASTAKERLAAGAESGVNQASSGLGDFAAAVRKASEELGQRDQSMAAGLMREVAGGIEQASNAIQGRSVGELGSSVADFARRQPAAFLIGATLAGVALGRLARASGEHDRSRDSVGGGSRSGGGGYEPPLSPGRSSASTSGYPTSAFGTEPLRPRETGSTSFLDDDRPGSLSDSTTDAVRSAAGSSFTMGDRDVR